MEEKMTATEDTQGKNEGLVQDRSNSILKVTPNMLCDFLNEAAPGVKCFYCGQSEYLVPPDPSGDIAAVVTIPVPHVKGLGAWMYMVVCPTCGNTQMFNANIVSPKILGES